MSFKWTQTKRSRDTTEIATIISWHTMLPTSAWGVAKTRPTFSKCASGNKRSWKVLERNRASVCGAQHLAPSNRMSRNIKISNKRLHASLLYGSTSWLETEWGALTERILHGFDIKRREKIHHGKCSPPLSACKRVGWGRRRQMHDGWKQLMF